MANVSLALLPVFTQNLMYIRCYRFLSLIFSANRVSRTRATSSAARERTTQLVCGSCNRKLGHVQTYLSTRVCRTQHPSDTLRLFRELNGRTSNFVKVYFNNSAFIGVIY
jgi:hypothetical protein